MKTIYAILFFLLLQSVTVSSLFAQNFIWAQKNTSRVRGTAIDGSGNCYIAGDYGTSAAFDTVTLSGPGYNNMFLAKYSPSGRFLFATRNTSGNDISILDMCSDHSNHLYIVGQYEGPLTLGSHTITSDIGILSYFLAKYDTSGNCLWLKSFNNIYSSGNYDIRVEQVACDNNDSVYVYGHSDGTYTLDGLSINHGTGKLFFAKLNPASGTAVWARQIQASNPTIINPARIAVDANNKIVVCGTYGDNLSPYPNRYCVFNTTDTLHTDSGKTRNLFVARYDDNGNYNWATQIDTFAANDFTGMSIDPNGNIFVTGVDFYAKFNTLGTRKWLHYMPTMAVAITCAPLGNYICDYSGNFFKTDTITGSTLWTRSLAGTPYYYTLLRSAQNGTILLSGNSGNLTLGATHLFMGGISFGYTSILSDTAFTPLANNRITGNIFNDSNNNCLLDTEPGLKSFGVIATPGPYYAVSDAAGNYTLSVDTGIYNVEVIVPASHAFTDSQLCSGTPYTVAIHTTGHTDTGYNFPNKYTPCSLLYVGANDLTHGCIRCDMIRQTDYSICNYGADTAINTIIHIQYPGRIISPLSSTLPWTSYSTTDSVMTFNLGNIPPDSCIRFTVSDSVSCAPSIYFDTFQYQITSTPLNTCYATDSIHNKTAYTDRMCMLDHTTQPTLPTNKVNIFPNPTTGAITITSLTDATSLIITDILGHKLLTTTEPLTPTTQLNLAHLPPALYFLHISFPDHNEILKLMKQ